ncbi:MULTISPECIES: TetR/AcrR family transcriptional regulator [Haloechinothrix]|uniref:TetR/AcrR family transcriptional regulator n=1 Tax=Haloechinothrix TaxID=1425377 RepID=UPI001FEB2E96|nr:TetR/AcrR family transcriptional regulator [Haloechinothrix alba]
MARTRATQASDTGRSARKSEQTRARILDAAAYVLSRKGYAGTRLGDIAERAEIQAPAIYYYFHSREDLVEEVMWVGIAQMREHLEDALKGLSADARPMERIELAVSEHLTHELEISDYTTAAIRNAGQVPEDIKRRYDREAKRYGDVWHELFEAARKAGELRADLDPMVARMLVMGALSWAAEWWNPRRESLATVTKTAVSFIRNGLQAAPDVAEGS